MSGEPSARGEFTQKLLARAEGRLQGAQPKLRDYFAGESGDNAPPIIERANEIPASPPSDRNRAALPNVPDCRARGPEPPAAKAAGPDDSFRLFSHERLAERGTRMLDVHSARTTADGAAPKAVSERQAAASAGPDRTRSNHDRAEILPLFDDAMDTGDQRLVYPMGTGFRLSFGHGTELLTAVAQLLGDRSGESAGRPDQADASARSDRERSVDRSNSRISDLLAREGQPGDQQQEPLTIHISEIVIAPDPAKPQADMQPRDKWQPPISLADYRAQRAREWK